MKSPFHISRYVLTILHRSTKLFYYSKHTHIPIQITHTHSFEMFCTTWLSIRNRNDKQNVFSFPVFRTGRFPLFFVIVGVLFHLSSLILGRAEAAVLQFIYFDFVPKMCKQIAETCRKEKQSFIFFAWSI